MTWSADLIDQLDFYWTVHFRPRLEGLTDAEYRWEPVPGMWSVRPDAAGRLSAAPDAAGSAPASVRPGEPLRVVS